MRVPYPIFGLVLVGCGSTGFEGLEPSMTDSLVGRILHRGLPVPGAPVHLVRDKVSVASVRTDAHGSYRFEPPPFTGPATLVAHDEAGHAGLQKIEIHGGGRNLGAAIMLEPVSRFPELVTYRGLGLDERLTDLSVSIAEYVHGPEGVFYPRRSLDDLSRTTLFFARPDRPRERGLLELELEDGHVDIVFDVSPEGLLWYDETIYARELEVETTPTHRIALFDRETNAELVRFESPHLSPTFRDEQRYLWFEVAGGTSTTGPTRALVVLADGTIERGPPLEHPVVDPWFLLGADGRALYYLAQETPEDPGSPGSYTVLGLDWSTLQSFRVSPDASGDALSSRPVYHDPVDGRLYLIRELEPNLCALTEVDLETGDLRDVFSLFSARPGCDSFWEASYGSVLLLRAQQSTTDPAAYYAVDLDAPSVAPVRIAESGLFHVYLVAGAHALFIDGSKEPYRYARLSYDALRFEELDTTAELDGERVDLCAMRCEPYILDDGTVGFVSVGSANKGGVDAILEIFANGEQRIRRYPSSDPEGADYFPQSPLRILGDLEVDTRRRDARDYYQLFVAPRGSAHEVFRQATFFPRSGTALLGASPDERWLYYLARDPLSGLTQLFRTSTERSIEGGAR